MAELCEAVRLGDMDKVHSILPEKGKEKEGIEKIDPSYQDQEGNTALHHASSDGRVRLVLALIGYGFDVNKQNKEGNTPAHLAAFMNKDGLVIWLMKKGGRMDIKNNSGHTVYDLSSVNLKKHLDLTRSIFLEINHDKGAKGVKTARPSARYNIEQSDAKNKLDLACKNGDLQTIKYIADRYQDARILEVKSFEGKAALHIAVENNQIETVKYLLERGVDVNREEEYMNTSVIISSVKGLKDVTSLLVSYGAELNIKSLFGVTPLLIACELGHFDVVKVLVEEGKADINIRDSEGFTGLHHSLLRRYDDIAYYLIKKGNADINIKDNKGRAPHIFFSKRLQIALHTNQNIEDIPIIEEDTNNQQEEEEEVKFKIDSRREIKFTDISISEESLGEGNFGTVFKGIYKGSLVAVKKLKTLSCSTRMISLFSNEAYLISQLQHENVLRLVGSCSFPPNICLVTEYVSNQTLAHQLYIHHLQLSNNDILNLAKGISSGMLHIHQHSIIHHDIRSANILLDDHWTPKIGDFGLAQLDSCIQPGTGVGSLRWMAPEVFRKEKYDQKADIYSFSMVMIEMLTGSVPFENDAPTQVSQRASNSSENRRPTIPSSCPSELSTLIRECWDPFPEKRPSSEKLVEILKGISPFV